MDSYYLMECLYSSMKAITGVTTHQICVFAVTDSFNSLPEPFWKCNHCRSWIWDYYRMSLLSKFCLNNHYCLSKSLENPSTVPHTTVCWNFNPVLLHHININYKLCLLTPVVKLGHSHSGRNIGWGCSRIGCWESYLGLGGMT